MKFSPFRPGTHVEIKNLFIHVFTDAEGEAEGAVLGKLISDIIRLTDDRDRYGFVVTENDQIIGSIFFTRLAFENGINAFLLSPVAIHTKYQGKGVGKRLIDFGMNLLQEKGVSLVCTYGDINFYAKVGFKSITEEIVKAPFKLSYPEGWLAQSLVGDEIVPIAGNSSCVEAFNKPDIW